MKLIKNWKFIFLLSIVAVYSIFAIYVFSEESSLPSEGFSRHMELTNIETDNFQESRNSSTISTMVLENGNIAILYYDKSLVYMEYSNQVEKIKEIDLKLSFPKLNEVILKDSSDQGLDFYILNASEVHNYHFNFATNESDKSVIYKDVTSLTASKNYIFITHKNNYTIAKNNDGIFKTVYTSAHKVRKISNLLDDDNLYLSYLANDEKGVQKLWYFTYNENTDLSELTNIATIPSSGNYSTSSLSLSKHNDSIHILQEGSDYKTGTSTLTIYSSKGALSETSNDTKGSLSFTKEILSGLKNANASKLISSSDNDFEFIARIPNKESDSQIAHDIYMFRYEDYKAANAKKLTRTRGNSANPNYIKSDKGNFLVWTDSVGLEKRILIAGDNDEIIKASSSLSSYDKTQISMNILFTLSPTLFTFLVPLLSIAGPVLFILIVLSFVNLTYLERNGSKILPIILILHILLKLRFIYSTLFETMPQIRAVLPAYINNVYLLFIFLGGLTGLSILISFLKNRDFLKGRDIWMSYITFMLIDVSITWLAIMPYIYMWLKVTPALNGGFLPY